ncbi:MAG TPA: undecaprenyldiphospho-muramoylpentapeptide beta-N-acetylglucosaminyltransferase, partial [candidate division Zixibacteria bacterium]|nr:undecaprenyldiphospho-muramoylpentapeptide beta-N-acetylglucosaminyltransferase [candidate division Zixibacteria bacterium]
LLAGTAPVEILFVGTRRGLEYRMRDALGYPLHVINVRGLVRALSPANLLVPFVLVTALVRAWLLLGRFRPDAVVGTGGYVALPVLKAARWRGVPTVLQEQNSFPGITTRQGAKHARKIYLGFDGARQYLRTEAEVLTTGNPVRRGLSGGDRAAAAAAFGLDPAKKTILVLGGSQGARAINEAVLRSLAGGAPADGCQILWQTGKRDYTEVSAKAGGTAARCALFPFAHDMAAVYAAADLAVARAGALTLAELAACAIPAILIPYPHAAGDHQRKNARDLAAAGLARVIDENDLPRHDLIAEAADLLEAAEYRTMREKLESARRQGRPATDIIAEDIIDLINRERKARA